MANVTIRVGSAPIRMIVRAAQGATTAGGGSGAATWGTITGTLSAQTDLQNALNAKQATLTNYSTISALTGYPSTFPPSIGTSDTTAAAGNHTHAQLHDAATVTGNGISISGQQISLSIGTGSTQVAAGNHLHAGVYLPVANPTATGSLTIDRTGGTSGQLVLVSDDGPTATIFAPIGYTADRDISAPDNNGTLALTARTDGVPDAILIGNNVVTANADFTLSNTTHRGNWTRLTKTGSTQTITLPTSGIDAGAEFQFFRATSQSLAFSGGTVNGGSRLADVVENSAFGLKHISAGTYDFV